MKPRSAANAASANTATGTTATVDPGGAASPPRDYVGRFAPSPTGSLHLGSLVAAVGSYLDARKAGGRWLVRIEDLDTSRVIPGCAAEMLRTLEAFGLCWDGEVEYQSRRTHRYAESLESLRAAGRTFECSCSRRELTSTETGYPGTCRNAPTRGGPTATRFRVDDSVTVSWLDRVQGPCQFELRALGDPVIRRRDGAFAYQLAVVVDDAAQGVSDVVRGADLLQSTAWQIQLQQALGLSIPRYAHLPVVMEAELGKLSKSRRSVAIDPANSGSQLREALTVLQYNFPAELQQAPPSELLAWATAHWSLDPFQGKDKFVVSRPMSHV